MKINKETLELNDITDQMDFTDHFRIFPPIATKTHSSQLSPE
jgi:hypothetical protein